MAVTVKQCEYCQRPHETRSGSCLRQTVLTIGVLLALLAILGVGTLRQSVTHLQRFTETQLARQGSQPPLLAPPENKSRCEFPIIYNKPHKTASSRIQVDLVRWAKQNKRHAYKCSPFILQATMQMRECIPYDRSGCAVIATHVIMSPTMTRILEKRVGEFALITSTREPHDRLLSMYLQERRRSAGSKIDVDDLKDWLKSYNPWGLYNYHTGEYRVGACPLGEGELSLIPDLVNRADIVIDADLYEVSSAILKWKGLFEISTERKNVRSAKDLELDGTVEELVKNATCVEDEMHRLYRLRMASLYEKATGERCLSHSRHPRPCF